MRSQVGKVYDTDNTGLPEAVSETKRFEVLGDQPITTMQTRTLFNKRVSGLSMAGAFVFLAIVVVVRFLASDPVGFRAPEPVKVRTFPVPHRVH